MKRVPLLVCAAIVAVAIGPWLWWWSSLPDPVASHWDIHGRANGHLAPIVLMLALGGVATVLAVSAAGTARHGTALPRPASGASVLAFVGGMLAVASLASVLANRDATSWHTAHLSAAWVIGAFAFGVVAALANGLVQPKASAGANTSRPAVTVGPTERVGWIGRSSARWVIALAVALVILGVVQTIVVSPLTGAIVVLSGIAVAAFSSAYVIASASGVRVRGPLGWPRVALALDRIESAEAIAVRPMQWGGWGYRGSLRLFRRAAWVVRRGAGLKLNLSDGKVFIVTVDDAEEAAAVVNGLLA